MRRVILKDVRDYLIMTFACLLFAVAWEGFLIPNQISSGGFMGISTVIQYATGGVLKASTVYMVGNIFLLLFAFAVMGFSFGFKTIYCILMTTVLMSLVGQWDWLHAVEGHFFYVQDRLLIPFIAGAIEGIALGIIFKLDGSTGGLDIIALFVSRYWPISTGRFFMICDSVIITSILFLPDRAFGDMVYGYIAMICSSLMIDFITLGAKQTVQLLVFSEHYEQIADHIINDMDRGVTVLRAQGWYTKQDKNVLLILMRKKELGTITKHIKQVDPHAFLSVSQASSVYGEGFEEIKTGIEKQKNKQNAMERQ